MKSIVSYPDRGPWGKSSYRGNCSGYLIKDIIEQFRLKSLSDYMVEGGTTEEVCRDLNIPGTFLDLNRGFDMLNMDIPEKPENIFSHYPAYGQMISYSGSMYDDKEVSRKFGINAYENDLSHSKNCDDFVDKMNYCTLKQFSALEKGGRMFLLMGDWKQKGRLYSMLADIVKPGKLEQIVIKVQNNFTSARKTYSNNNFIPIIHEYLLILKKESSLIIPVSETVKKTWDLRKCYIATWRDVISAVLEENGTMKLDDIYDAVKDSPKVKNNNHWHEKIRHVLQDSRYFKRLEIGVYCRA